MTSSLTFGRLGYHAYSLKRGGDEEKQDQERSQHHPELMMPWLT